MTKIGSSNPQNPKRSSCVCTSSLLIVFAVVDLGVNAAAFLLRGESWRVWSGDYELLFGDSCVDLFVAACCRVLLILAALGLFACAGGPVAVEWLVTSDDEDDDDDDGVKADGGASMGGSFAGGSFGGGSMGSGGARVSLPIIHHNQRHQPQHDTTAAAIAAAGWGINAPLLGGAGGGRAESMRTPPALLPLPPLPTTAPPMLTSLDDDDVDNAGGGSGGNGFHGCSGGGGSGGKGAGAALSPAELKVRRKKAKAAAKAVKVAKADVLFAKVRGGPVLLVWALFAAQVCLVVGKCVSRMTSLAGDKHDWVFWVLGVLAGGVLLPLLEASAASSGLEHCAQEQALRRGWTTAGSAKKEADNKGNNGEKASSAANYDVHGEDDDEDSDDDGDGSGDLPRNASLSDAWRFLKMDWPLMLLALSGLTVAAAGESVIPYLYGSIIEAVALDGDLTKFHEYMLALVCVSAVTGVATGVRGSTFIVLGARFSTRLREALFESLLSLDVGFYDQTKTGDVSSRISADCQKVGDQVELNVNVFLRSVIQVVLTIAFMYFLNWQLATLAFITVPNIVIASKLFGAYMRNLTKKVQKALADSTSEAEEALGSMRTVKSLHAEKEMAVRYAKLMVEYRILSYRAAAVYFPFSALTYTFLPYCASCLVLYYGGKLIHHGHLSSGQLVAFVFYMQSLFNSFSTLGNIYVALVQALGAADKVYEWITRETKSTVPREGKGERPVECRGDLEIHNVTFAYPQRPERVVLDRLSLRLEPGKVLALCGASGGGKSSVMALLQNWYEPTCGDIFLDGLRIRDLNQAWYHKRVAMVAQEPVLYARSVLENVLVGLGDEDGDDEDGPRGNVATTDSTDDFLWNPWRRRQEGGASASDSENKDMKSAKKKKQGGVGNGTKSKGARPLLSSQETRRAALSWSSASSLYSVALNDDDDDGDGSQGGGGGDGGNGQESVLEEGYEEVEEAGGDGDEEDGGGGGCGGAKKRTSSKRMAAVVAACKLANAHEFIVALPEGYHTQVGERGAQLSGGQRQRVAIARALVRRPRVLLLDEATSALDAESEFQVQSAIDGMLARGDLTVLIIAHRLSTIRKAHNIAVIGGGAVLEQGTHGELLKAEGHYAKLAKRQMGTLGEKGVEVEDKSVADDANEGAVSEEGGGGGGGDGGGSTDRSFGRKGSAGGGAERGGGGPSVVLALEATTSSSTEILVNEREAADDEDDNSNDVFGVTA